MTAYAHSANENGVRHLLTDHLGSVAKSVCEFARSCGGGEIARYWACGTTFGRFHAGFHAHVTRCKEPWLA